MKFTMETIRALLSRRVYPVLHGKHQFAYLFSRKLYTHAQRLELVSDHSPGLQMSYRGDSWGDDGGVSGDEVWESVHFYERAEIGATSVDNCILHFLFFLGVFFFFFLLAYSQACSLAFRLYLNAYFWRRNSQCNRFKIRKSSRLYWQTMQHGCPGFS